MASCAPPGAGILAGKILDHHRREGQFSLFEEEFILPSLIGDRIFVRRMDCREKKGEKLCIDIYICSSASSNNFDEDFCDDRENWIFESIPLLV